MTKTEKSLHKLKTYRNVSSGAELTDNHRTHLKSINLRYLKGYNLPCSMDWYPSDTKEKFESRPKEDQEYWNKQSPIKYNLNSYGHRCGEIVEDAESIMFLGCSMTFGVGMHKEHTWPALVAQSFGKTEYNLGVPGGSLDSCYRLYKEWLPIAKSSVTILAVPPHYRCEKILEHDMGIEYANIGQWTIAHDLNSGNEKQATRNLVEDLNDSAMYIAFNKNIDAIKKVAEDHGSRLILIDYVQLGSTIISKERGRDGIHPSSAWHTNVAKNVIKLIGI